jgi:hypothetical protein
LTGTGCSSNARAKDGTDEIRQMLLDCSVHAIVLGRSPCSIGFDSSSGRVRRRTHLIGRNNMRSRNGIFVRRTQAARSDKSTGATHETWLGPFQEDRDRNRDKKLISNIKVDLTDHRPVPITSTHTSGTNPRARLRIVKNDSNSYVK